jgi:hypothetical protein
MSFSWRGAFDTANHFVSVQTQSSGIVSDFWFIMQEVAGAQRRIRIGVKTLCV